MKATYRFPLSRPLKLEDHWPVPLLGGVCRMVEEDGLIVAIELTKTGLPISFAPTLTETPEEPIKATIAGHDDFHVEARDLVKSAFNFLQCFFDTSIKVRAIDVTYEPEGEENDEDLPVKGMTVEEGEVRPLSITYDFITRALMAAESEEPPEFTSSLAMLAREALTSQRFIDSFRFSFLLIESLFGGGKTRNYQLGAAFESSEELRGAIEHAIRSIPENRIKHPSQTVAFLNSKPPIREIIDHLISMRGHYFHGNIKKSNSWNAANQGEAEGLAWFCADMLNQISSNAAAPMFRDEYSARHFEEAGKSGAHVMVRMELIVRPALGERLRRQQINIRMPGTKVTTVMAMEAVNEGIRLLRADNPEARLHSVVGFDDKTKRRLFDLRIHIEPDDAKS